MPAHTLLAFATSGLAQWGKSRKAVRSRDGRWQSEQMFPPPGAKDLTMSAPDAFDVPVFVRRSSPLSPAPRPSLASVGMVQRPWPASSSIPPDGDYLVTTTWRALLDATTTVGRDITPWVAAVPRLARREIMARRYPLSAYLVRNAVRT